MGCCISEEEGEKIGGFRKYEVEGWLRSFKEVADVKADPKKLAAVEELAGEGLAAVTSIKQLKKKAGIEDPV